MYIHFPGASGHKGIYIVIAGYSTVSNSLQALVEFFLLVSGDICLSITPIPLLHEGTCLFLDLLFCIYLTNNFWAINSLMGSRKLWIIRFSGRFAVVVIIIRMGIMHFWAFYTWVESKSPRCCKILNMLTKRTVNLLIHPSSNLSIYSHISRMAIVYKPLESTKIKQRDSWTFWNQLFIILEWLQIGSDQNEQWLS